MAPVPTLPLCPCENCDAARKALGPLMAHASTLFPARNADFMAQLAAYLMSATEQALKVTCAFYQAEHGMELDKVHGVKALFAAVLLMPLIDQGLIDEPAVRALAESMVARSKQGPNPKAHAN